LGLIRAIKHNMTKDRDIAYKKALIEQYLKKEFDRHFGRGGRISIRKRQRFMERVTKKISKKFGKDVMCLVDFTRQGFVTLISPPHSESTEKGKLIRSFAHPQVVYTTHCVDRFSERAQTTDNCIVALDACLDEALLTYGVHPGHLVCSVGVLAYEVEAGRLIIKTFINFEMLSDEQIQKFYDVDVLSIFSQDIIAENAADSDIIISDEFPLLNDESKSERGVMP